MHLYAYIYIYTDEAETQQINDMPSSEKSTRDDHSCPYWLGSTQEDIDSDGEDDKTDLFQSLAICDNNSPSARKESKEQLSANPSTNLSWVIKNHILCPLMMLKMKLS